MEKLVTHDAAAALGLHVDTLRRYAREGAPHERERDGSMRFDLSAVRGWMAGVNRTGDPGRPRDFAVDDDGFFDRYEPRAPFAGVLSEAEELQHRAAILEGGGDVPLDGHIVSATSPIATDLERAIVESRCTLTPTQAIAYVRAVVRLKYGIAQLTEDLPQDLTGHTSEGMAARLRAAVGAKLDTQADACEGIATSKPSAPRPPASKRPAPAKGRKGVRR